MMLIPSKLTTDTYTWKLYLGDEFKRKKKSADHLDYDKSRKEFQKFQLYILETLGGTPTLYFDDHSYQEPVDQPCKRFLKPGECFLVISDNSFTHFPAHPLAVPFVKGFMAFGTLHFTSFLFTIACFLNAIPDQKLSLNYRC